MHRLRYCLYNPNRRLTVPLLRLFTLVVVLCGSHVSAADWQRSVNTGDYDGAVATALDSSVSEPLSTLVHAARSRNLADSAMWRALLHYKPTFSKSYLSQVDSTHFFLSDQGKRDPKAELDATLAALFATEVKAPLRLTAYCRFVARRHWLMEQLSDLKDLLPAQPCEEFDRFESYLEAHVLTLIFPTAYPNSPSSAFGHTLIRIDKKDQPYDSRLLNMSINFAAEVPVEVSAAAYAINGLAGGFPGKYRLLPYHIKLREYGQIENRDTWEYELKLSQQQVDSVLRHAYELLIVHYDYYFLSENCSYHLLSLLDVVFADDPLTEGFGLWTIPIDTIKQLREKGLINDGRFVPSSIRTLRERRALLEETDNSLALQALASGLPTIDSELSSLPAQRQAGVLDMLADYQRYRRLQDDAGAQSTSDLERSILSRRSKVPVKTKEPVVPASDFSPELGHGTSRVGLRYASSNTFNNIVELTFRPAYHDFRDPSAAYGANSAIDFGKIGVAQDLDADKTFVSSFTPISIESIEPRGGFLKPISWHTRINWVRESAEARHRFTFNVGAGAAYQLGAQGPLAFAFLESDVVDDTSFQQRTSLRLGVGTGLHWEPVAGFRTGVEYNYRRQVDDSYEVSTGEIWGSVAIAKRMAIVVDATWRKRSFIDVERIASAELRVYF